MTDPTTRRAIGDAFVTGLHAGYLVAGGAMLVCTLLAVVLLRALHPRQPVPAPRPGPEVLEVAAPRSSS